MKKLEDKIEKLVEVNARQDVHLERLTVLSEKNTENLEFHMRRTEANEERIAQVEDALLKSVQEMQSSVGKVETSLNSHLSFLKGAFWVFTALATAAGLVAKFL